MGEDKTPPPFRKACDIFTVLELLLEDSMLEKPEKAAAHAVVGKESKKESAGAVSKSQIEEAVVKIITEIKTTIRRLDLERSEAVWSNCTRISMCEDMDTVCCPSFWKHFQN